MPKKQYQYQRRAQPATIAEMISIAAWLREGVFVSTIAARCRRPITQVRAIMEDRSLCQ